VSLLGLDMGTSACKAAVFDEGGQLVCLAAREYEACLPRPGWVEMDPDRMWNAAVDAVREVSAKTADRIQALAVSSQGETFVPTDADGRAVGTAIMNVDNRAVDEVRFFEQAIGKEGVYSITGCVLHPMYALLKILWLRNNRPEVFDKTSKFLSVGDYILARLGASPYTDHSLASRTMAFDVTARKWSGELLAIAGLEPDLFPEAHPAGTIAGELPAGVAAATGLAKGTIVAVGGHDQPCGALGAGVVDTGDAVDSAGTYECLTVASDAPVLSPTALSYNVNSYCHVVPARYVTLAFFPAGVVVRWFLDNFASAEVAEAARANCDPYALLTSRISKEPSGICFTPHFIGSGNPTWDVRASGVVVGLRPDRTRHHLFQAILEGIACELLINVRVLESLLSGIDVLRTTGGGARSAYWLQLRADITGRKVATMRTSEAACLGAAILAGVAAGVYSDAPDGARRVSGTAEVYRPNAERAALYAEQVAQYEKVYPALAASGVYG